MKYRCTFIEECLGTLANDPKITELYIASLAPDAISREEEVAAIGVDAVVKKAMTVFPRENGRIFIWDYQIKGMFKGACGALRKSDGDYLSKEVTAHKQLINQLIFPKPRKIFINIPEGLSIGNCQRPLRGQTAQGETISLANSETVPAGSFFEFTVKSYTTEYESKKKKLNVKTLVEEWLSYVEDSGFLQWRNAGKGRFVWEEIK